MRQELEATRHEPDTSTTTPEPARTPAPGRGRLGTIDYAVEQVGIESFASIEIGQAYGQYAFYTIDKPTVQDGVLVDVGARNPGDYLLSTIEQAAERPGMRVLDGSFADPRTMSQIGQVDAILLFDVLFRMVDPDWDQVLELYAPATSSFVIANPQWERSEATVRLIDLGREKYLEAVPPWDSHHDLFDDLDAWLPGQQRRYRDGDHVWQWGITDADLKAKMSELGFSEEREWILNQPPETDGFVNKTFVFRRS
jgi:hypothetical protein